MIPVIYKSHSAKPISYWRIEWEIDVAEDDFHGPDFDGHMEVEFHDEKDYAEYLETLREAEAEGMCRNVKSYTRTVTIGEWERQGDTDER